MIQLVVPWYHDPVRRLEYAACLKINCQNPLIDKIILMNEKDAPYPWNGKIVNVPIRRRPTFKEMIPAEIGQKDLTVIANTDIFFDEGQTLQLVRYLSKDTCWALSRWNVVGKTANLYAHQDSQDAWFFFGPIKSELSADIPIGVLGCDNRFAFELQKVGYRVLNPCKSLKVYHLHNTETRAERNARHPESERVSPPYLYLPPKAWRPSLSIVTRKHPRRPTMFAKCLTSVHSQDDPDYEHVILEDRIGIGVAGANKMFYNNRHLVTGEYVYMLDDDDVLTTPDFISDMKAIIREHNNPGIIFIRGYINDELHPTLPCWESDRMYQNRVDTQCFVVRHDLWQAHISNFGAPRCGDFFFIDSVFKTKPVVVWHDRTYFKTLKVSRGADE